MAAAKSVNSKKSHSGWNTAFNAMQVKSNLQFNSFMTRVPIIQKPVHWFALQVNGLIST